MAIRAEQFDMTRLLETFLRHRDHPWRKDVEIIEGYTSPHQTADAMPITVVRWRGWYLKYSKGPEGAPFWDSSGDDFMTPELALKAVLRAPGPPTSWD